MSEDNDGDNDGNNDEKADWRQVTKGRRAVTHTDERQATPVHNQFQGLSEHQEDPTPRLAPRELIAAFSRLPQDDNNTDIPDEHTNQTLKDRTSTLQQCKATNTASMY
jgi:hypothetical protein